MGCDVYHKREKKLITWVLIPPKRIAVKLISVSLCYIVGYELFSTNKPAEGR
jgi:hypothetical protein